VLIPPRCCNNQSSHMFMRWGATEQETRCNATILQRPAMQQTDLEKGMHMVLGGRHCCPNNKCWDRRREQAWESLQYMERSAFSTSCHTKETHNQRTAHAHPLSLLRFGSKGNSLRELTRERMTAAVKLGNGSATWQQKTFLFVCCWARVDLPR